MEQSDYDDESPAAMLSSWIIISELGQALPSKQPLITDLQKLCKAADQCALNIHKQLTPLFRRCNLPLSTHQEPHEFVVIYNLSPVNEFLKSVQLLDPNDDTNDSPVIDDYQPLLQASSTIKASSPILARSCSPTYNPESAPTMSTVRERATSLNRLVSSAIAYPLYPFQTVIEYVKKQTLPQEPQAQVQMVHASCDPNIQEDRLEQDQRMINHKKYQRALTHGKKLLKGVTACDAETRTLLEQLREQLVTLQAGITTNIERIEADRASFNTLQQCVCPPEMNISDMFLLQYCKMSAHKASLDTAMKDFNLPGNKLTDVTQEQFEARWQNIQELYRTGTMSSEQFDQLRQYCYILQNATSRHIAQAFIDGTVNNYGMTQKVAHERGLTDERIAELTTELSNCKDFLLQLNKAFNDSRKNIEAAMKE